MENKIQLTSKDPLFENAARAVVNHQQCSLPFLALELGIGAERTAIILADLEVTGIISSFDVNKGRTVLFAHPAQLDEHLKQLDEKATPTTL